MARAGYIRESTLYQNVDLQHNALNCANCDLTLEDKINGKTALQPGLKRALKVLKTCDPLVV